MYVADSFPFSMTTDWVQHLDLNLDLYMDLKVDLYFKKLVNIAENKPNMALCVMQQTS